MVEKTNVSRPSVSTAGPNVGMVCRNAALVSSAPFSTPSVSGACMTLVTITRPDSAQITTVSQNVPVADTSACRTGFLDCAAAATIGAEPRPDSFENRPRATP